MLRDATVTMKTITDQRDELARFLADTTDLATTTRSFLDRYDDRIIQLGHVSRPVLELLAAYAPEYPCLLQGLVALQPRVEKVFATGRMHITLETTRDNGKFVKGRDEPVYRRLFRTGLPRTALARRTRPAGAGERRLFRHGAPAAVRPPWGSRGQRRRRPPSSRSWPPPGSTTPEDVSDLRRAAVGADDAGTAVSVGMKATGRTRIAAPLAKLTAFAVITAVLTAYLAGTLGSLGFGGGRRTRRMLTDVTESCRATTYAWR